jgi:hypothetical protein
VACDVGRQHAPARVPQAQIVARERRPFRDEVVELAICATPIAPLTSDRLYLPPATSTSRVPSGSA